MRKIEPFRLIFTVAALMFITACSTATPEPTESPQPTIATLPATSVPPTDIPAPQSETQTTQATQDPECTNEALFIADVTIPDETVISASEAFTKTWELQNIGTCTWNESYSLNFANGDQMNSPLSIPLNITAPNENLQISVDLISPTANGTYTGIYQLRDTNGDIFNIGTLDNIWLKIVVNDGTAPPTSTPAPAGSCNPDRNTAYENEILTLINNARASSGQAALSINIQLQVSADVHSKDMACNDLISHTGSDGSSVSSRVTAQGYTASYVVENIYVGGTAQDAFTWWMNDQLHRDAILDARVSEIGIGYAYLGTSTYGSYFAVDFASP